MKIVNRNLSLQEFKDYIKTKNFGSVPPSFIVLHHTWVPDEKQWHGQTSIYGLKKYYEQKGWTAGPHLFIAEDGIWLFTDMYEIGIHAGAGNGSLKTGYSIGIEVVGNYDKKVWSGKTYWNTVGAIDALMKRLNIKQDKIMFHREFSSKTCPGTVITKSWVAEQIKKLNTPIEQDYEGNFKRILKYVGKFLGKDYGEQPSNEETEEIKEKLNG